MASILQAEGFETVPLLTLDDWTPGSGGAVVIVRSSVPPDALGDFNREHPHIPVLGVIDLVDVSTFAAWVRAGAVGVLSESDDPADYVHAISTARNGRAPVPFKILRAMAQRVPTSDDLSTWANADEQMWLQEMASGRTVAELAAELGYSERAMFRNLRRLYVRLGVKNRTEALLWADRSGVLDTPPAV